jgi:Rieske Fe-S protein
MQNSPIGDPDYYPESQRQPTPPAGDSSSGPACGSTSGLTVGPAAKSLSVNQAVMVGMPSQRLVICRSDDGLFGLLLTCTHAGCEPALSETDLCWVCPCHGSVYNFDGSLAGLGPAPTALTRYYVCEGSDGNLYLDTAKTI